MAVKTHNLYSNIPAQLHQELFETLLEREGMRLERIVSRGQASAEGEWYDQEQDEWVVLLSGSAILQIDGEEPRHLTPGDYLLLPAHCRHRVVATAEQETSVWLALHLDKRGWQ